MVEVSPIQQAASIHSEINYAMKKAGLDGMPKQPRRELVAFVAQTHFGARMMVSERHEGNAGQAPVIATQIGSSLYDLSGSQAQTVHPKGVNMRPAQALEVLSPQGDPEMERRYLKVRSHLSNANAAQLA